MTAEDELREDGPSGVLHNARIAGEAFGRHQSEQEMYYRWIDYVGVFWAIHSCDLPRSPSLLSTAMSDN